MSASASLERLRETLTETLPYCCGTLELPDEAFELYYGKGTPKYINLRKATDESLQALQSACEPAKFGKGDETVLDETYRKAGKMDTSEFVLRLDVIHSGLLGAACSSLLSGEQVKRSVTAELYKLNVYGEGAFFKAHKDTPRSANMFGSLVVVFPTPHSGGALALRHDGKEWTFDSAKILANAPNRVAYVAFFSDVEHEVMPVVSGHRVTATYNLYWDDSDPRETAHPRGWDILEPKNANSNNVGKALAALMDDNTFLPEGGTLGFRLRHSYPFPRVWHEGDPDPLSQLPRWLKGSDAALYEALGAIGLQPKLGLSTMTKGPRKDGLKEYHTILLDRPVQFDTCTQVEEYDVEDELMHHGGAIVHTTQRPSRWPSDKDYNKRDRKLVDDGCVTWVTGSAKDDEDLVTLGHERESKPNRFSSEYVAYGNEAGLAHLYMTACLTVEVGPASNRTSVQEVRGLKPARSQ